VLLLDVDLSNGAVVESVMIGDTTISSKATGLFTWVDTQTKDDIRVLAIRVPATTPTGTVPVRLKGLNEVVSEPFQQRVISADVLSPVANSTIVVTIPGIKGYPVGTTSSFPQHDPENPIPATSDHWWYDLNIQRTHLNPGSNPPECDKFGSISGYERLCASGNNKCDHGNGCIDTKTCYTLTGSYHADENTNYAEFAVDRGSPLGPERYVGGWAGNDLVMRSQRTGRQMVIQHTFESACWL